MTKLLSSQISGQNGRVRFCMRCLNSFGSVEARSEHIEICQGHEPVTVLKPDDENVKLKNMNYKMPVLFVCYADFEFSTEGIETWEKKTRKELQMNMRNTGLQDIASSLQARERKTSLIWSQSWDKKGLKIKILQNNSSFILGKV